MLSSLMCFHFPSLANALVSRRTSRFLAFGVCLLAGPLLAQRGDKKGEVQGDLPPELRLPEAPPLQPDAALAAFSLVDGYRIEIAACEPLVEDPVQVVFDARGRLYVVEMRGFMPDPDGKGEHDPTGKIAILEDRDGDGRFESRTDFLDELVLPRGVLPYQDGVLVILPPRLEFARDTDGDGVADEREVVLDRGFEAGLDNPEHAGNQPTLAHDGWIDFANFGRRVRRRGDGTWETHRTHTSGQWGLSQDDWGLHVYNYNSSWLHGDRFAAHYAVRNPALGVALGVGDRLTNDQTLFPIRPNPGINRGYQNGMLRDGKLARTTAVCGPGVYRGGLLPDAWIGDVFIPEPAGNLVRQMKITVDDRGQKRADNRWQDREFLASTDERFRPVQCLTGPDGALYVVDFYRGILQHRNFLTTFLRKQIEQRKLATPIGLGRIYRIVPEGSTAARTADLTAKASIELVALHAHRNGIVRELAQEELIRRSTSGLEADVRRALVDLCTHDFALARYHAARTLARVDALTDDAIVALLHDDEPRVRALGVELSEGRSKIDLTSLVRDPSPIVRVQLALSTSADAARLPVLAALLELHADDRGVRQAAVTGFAGRELEFAAFLGARPHWKTEAPDGGVALWRRLAQCVGSDRKPDNITRLLDFAVSREATWQRRAIAEGLVASLPKGNARKGSIRFANKPAALAALREVTPARTFEALDEAITWKGKSGSVAEAKPLTPDQERLFKLGKHYFVAHCVQCHQADGRGQAGLAPSLHDSPIVLGPAARQIRVVLHGLTGPVEIAGKTQELTMEPLGPKLNDRQIAAILTFTRRSWGHTATAVDPQEVTRARSATGERKLPWTREELSKIE
ncbi:MAG: c-type cytochrome [Planctomycetes bacterium]|nr:c-type cytochrome [Planctomycetota bacterium]